MQKPNKYLRLCVVIWVWLKFPIHLANCNFPITHEKGVESRGPALLKGVWKLWHPRLLGDRFMCFHRMPHFSCAVPWPAHFPRSFWFRIWIVPSPPSHSPADSDMLFERIPGNTNPSGISMRVACLKTAAPSFVHLPPYRCTFPYGKASLEGWSWAALPGCWQPSAYAGAKYGVCKKFSSKRVFIEGSFEDSHSEFKHLNSSPLELLSPLVGLTFRIRREEVCVETPARHRAHPPRWPEKPSILWRTSALIHFLVNG